MESNHWKTGEVESVARPHGFWENDALFGRLNRGAAFSVMVVIGARGRFGVANEAAFDSVVGSGVPV